MKYLRGFTLIELLMVVSIMGFISSIVVGRVNDARESGRIAAGQQFSQGIKNFLGDRLIAEWSLNGTSTENTGFIQGCVADTSSGGVGFADGLFDQGVIFDGAGGYIRCTDDFNVVSPEKITVELWVNIPRGTDNGGGNGRMAVATWSGTEGPVYQKVLLQANSTEIKWWPDAPNATSLTVATSLTGWRHIAATFDYGTKFAEIYVDGTLAHAGTLGSLSQNSWSRVLIGRYRTTAGDMRPFVGTIDNVRIYEKTLSLAEINTHYVEEVEKYRQVVLED